MDGGSIPVNPAVRKAVSVGGRGMRAAPTGAAVMDAIGTATGASTTEIPSGASATGMLLHVLQNPRRPL